jgi:hypothetical protein
MKAHDVMVSPVVTVKPSATVKDVAKLFWNARSALFRSWTDRASSSALSAKATWCTAPRSVPNSVARGGYCCPRRTRRLPPITSGRTAERLKT